MNKMISPTVLLAFALVFTASCAKPAAEEQPQVVKIGMDLALTGSAAAWGWPNYAGAKLHIQQINESQDNYELELIAEDDASDCEQSVNAAMKLITVEEVVALIGTVNSQCTLMVVPITQEHQIPQFTTSVGTAITQQGSDYIFRVQAPNDYSTEQIVDYAVGTMGLKSIAALYSNDEYGKSGAEGVAAALQRRGMDTVAYESFVKGDRDFTAQLTIVRDAGADALYISGDYVAAALMAEQMKGLGMDIPIIGSAGYGYPEYADLGGDAINGTVFVETFYPFLEDPATQQFGEAFVKEYQKEPSAAAAQAYDMVGLIYTAIERAGTIDRQVVKDYVAGLSKDEPYIGVLGPIWFDDNGDPAFPMLKLMWQDGQVQLLER